MLHWAALIASLVSLAMLTAWVFGEKGTIRPVWAMLDIGLGIGFALEFFTRSGFRWDPGKYALSRFFDFVAMVPALAVVQHGLPYEEVWLWAILAARAVRAADRLLGDGFVRRNTMAMAEGFEEEITDRVVLRLIGRAEEGLEHGRLAHKVSEALARNRDPVLQRIRAAHPRDGMKANLAQFVGLTASLERAEEGTYDAIVEIMDSPEVDRAIRDAVRSSFAGVRQEMGKKHWSKRLGVRPRAGSGGPGAWTDVLLHPPRYLAAQINSVG
ncbi:MAG: hypothetical protein Q7T04_04550 [Dehalococcoidia bacterium]|nr:hypothetical protein [Dehalococcoidia bacterium]